MEDESHAKFAGGLRRANALVLVCNRRKPIDHKELVITAKPRDDAFGEAVADIVLSGIAIEIGEGENGNRGFVFGRNGMIDCFDNADRQRGFRRNNLSLDDFAPELGRLRRRFHTKLSFQDGTARFVLLERQRRFACLCMGAHQGTVGCLAQGIEVDQTPRGFNTGMACFQGTQLFENRDCFFGQSPALNGKPVVKTLVPD